MSNKEPVLPSRQVTCHIRQSIEILGNKWTLLILREFLVGKKSQRFNQLLRELKPISSRTLSSRLKDLELQGLVIRHVVTSQPIAVHYEITRSGEKIFPILRAMGVWEKSGESK